MSSWLSGPREALESQGVDFGYRGERLGLPAEGAGSIARFGRRLGALAIDWVASLLLVRLVFPNLVPTPENPDSQGYSLMVLLVFGLEVALLTWLTSASFGQRILGLSVVRVNGTRVGLWRAFVRTALLCLAVPALIWDRDGRGLHDKAVGSVCVKAR
jgi:hypothetical protein